LKRNAPRLGAFRRFVLSTRAPFILAIMAQLMMQPASEIVRTYDTPKDVIREAYTENPTHRDKTLEALHKVRDLLREIGVLTPRSAWLWKRLGIWPAPGIAC